MPPRPPKPMLGWREWVALPALGVARMLAKVDTGARTSALDTTGMQEFEEDGVRKVRFQLPLTGDERATADPTGCASGCVAAVVDSRWVTNSGGGRERRVVIHTPVVIGALRREIEITLADRRAMKFRMLLGRTALAKAFTVNPNRSCLAGEPQLPPAA